MTYKVGIIGTGFGTKVQFPAMNAHPDFEVVALAGRDFDKAKKQAEELGITAYEDWRELLFLDIDLISVATPPYLHFEMAMEVMKAGKHLLLEKPTTSNADEAKQLFRYAEDHGLVGMMSHEFRNLPERAYLRELIQEGKAGKLREVHMQEFFGFAARSDVPKFGWLWQSLYDGGMLGAIGSHVFDWLRYTIDDEFKSLQGSIYTRNPVREDHDGNLHEVTADDGFSMVFETKKGVAGDLVLTCTMSPAPASRLLISGDKGTFMLEGKTLSFGEIGKPFEEISIPESYALDNSLIEKDGRIPPYIKFLDILSKSLKDGISYEPSLYDGWMNQEVLDALKLSNKTGDKINL
jgi:predicted dehydrogenase